MTTLARIKTPTSNGESLLSGTSLSFRTSGIYVNKIFLTTDGDETADTPCVSCL